MKGKRSTSTRKGTPSSKIKSGATTKNSKIIKASPETLYQALTDPKALAVWLAPDEMTAKVHRFNLKVGGGYTMSLFYPESKKESRGKTTENEDRYTSRFVELTPFKKIIQAITFDSENPDFAGEMIMEVTFEPKGSATKVMFVFKNIPPGIRPEDNKAGTRSTLKKLASFVE